MSVLFFETMAARRLAWRLWPHVQLPWWRGRIDFVDRSTGIRFQVDGEHHFLGRMYGTPRAEFVARDAANCAAALGSGSTLMRLHHMDVLSGAGPARAAAILCGAEAGPRRPCVMLSPAFNLAGPTTPSKIPKQMRLVRAILSACPARAYSDRQRWICIEL